MLSTRLKSRKISAVELLSSSISAYDNHNNALNAVVWADIDKAIEAARSSDERLSTGNQLGMLDGIPATIKESFDWRGSPTTWGIPELANNMPTTNAHVVDRLLDDGAVLWGKTNVPLGLKDWQSFNEIYGTTNNPWDVSLSPGGSSGGSAVAVATGMSCIEVGSDIGGSIRNPAHYCGIFGHKPTWGIISTEGNSPIKRYAPTDMSVAGPMARSAFDIENVMRVLVGVNGGASRGFRYDMAPPRHSLLSDFRVAVMLSAPESEVDKPVQDMIERLAKDLSPLVKKISFDARPGFTTREAMDVFLSLLFAASSRDTAEDFNGMIGTAERMHPDDHGYRAIRFRNTIMRHRDWLMLNDRRMQMLKLWEEFFKDWDVLLCPPAASTAVPHDQDSLRSTRTIMVNGRKVLTMDQMFWAGYSGAFYLPSTIAPLGLASTGLPSGVQIITAHHLDMTSIRFAQLLELESLSRFINPYQ